MRALVLIIPELGHGAMDPKRTARFIIHYPEAGTATIPLGARRALYLALSNQTTI